MVREAIKRGEDALAKEAKANGAGIRMRNNESCPGVCIELRGSF